jgi:hypothetical protein
MKNKVLTFVKVLVEPNGQGLLKEKYLLESVKNIFHPEVVGVGSIVGHRYVVDMSKKKDVDVIISERDSSGKFLWMRSGEDEVVRGNMPPDEVY